MTRLYDYWRSSASYRVRMALNLLGVGFEAIPVDLLQAEQVGAANMARNPQGLVPSVETRQEPSPPLLEPAQARGCSGQGQPGRHKAGKQRTQPSQTH